MKSATFLNAFNNCQGRKSSIVANRPKGNFGIAVNEDAKALEWQRLDRIADKCYQRVLAKLTAADALAVALEEVEWDEGGHCLWCYGWERIGGHSLDCRRQVALRGYREAGR